MIELKPVGEETYDSFLDDMIRLYAAESIEIGTFQKGIGSPASGKIQDRE